MFTSSVTIDIPQADPVGASGGGHAGAVLTGLTGVSPVLAGAYLGYLVVRMLIPAVLIIATIGGVPAKQRSALLQTYLGACPLGDTSDHPQQQAITRPPAALDDPAAITPAQAGGDHVPGPGDDE